MPALNKISVDNVVYDIGSNCLIVTINTSAGTASHSASEIRSALSANIPTYIKMDVSYDAGGTTLFVPVFGAETYDSHSEDNIAISTYVVGYADEDEEYEGLTIVTLTIKEDKSIESVNISPVTDSVLRNALDRYLSKTNTTVYNPSSDYNPATKKYVDDHDYNITSGTTDPSGGSDGDIYLKYEA